jgi:hypothetical protein
MLTASPAPPSMPKWTFDIVVPFALSATFRTSNAPTPAVMYGRRGQGGG